MSLAADTGHDTPATPQGAARIRSALLAGCVP